MYDIKFTWTEKLNLVAGNLAIELFRLSDHCKIYRAVLSINNTYWLSLVCLADIMWANHGHHQIQTLASQDPPRQHWKREKQ